VRPEDIRFPPNVPEDKVEGFRKAAAGYYAMVANIDHNVGRVLDWLESSGLADNTLVVFFADHGDMLGGQGRFGKTVPYDESIRIPLVLRLPRRVPAGTRYDAPVSGIDIFPTTAGLCGVPVFPEVQGMDQSQAISGLPGQRRSEALIQWLGQSRYHWGDHPYRALRTQRHTYCVSSQAVNETGKGAFRLLFDNEADPYQMDNLFGHQDARDLQRDLHRRLCAAIANSGESLPDFVAELSGELGF